MLISELEESDRLKALEYQSKETKEGHDKNTDIIADAFYWDNTEEGNAYWRYLDETPILEPLPKQPHYDNSNGSIYKFCDDQKLNSYEFDIIKRIVRCRKKGNWIEDLEKTKTLIDLYITEQCQNHQ
jgi:hypothetical protein